MKILLVGSGGREHSLAWKIKQSKLCDRLFIAPGNPGMAPLGDLLPIKSDDIQGRSAAFDAIVKGESISHTGTPASFGVLTNQIRGLALDVEPLNLPPLSESD